MRIISPLINYNLTAEDFAKLYVGKKVKTPFGKIDFIAGYYNNGNTNYIFSSNTFSRNI